MIITFKEFKKSFKSSVSVYVGKFRYEGTKQFADENPAARGFENFFLKPTTGTNWYFDMSSIECLPLSDNYKMDVYTDAAYLCNYSVNTKSEVDYKANKVFVVAPSFKEDVQKAYRRAHKYCINQRVLAGVSVALRTWIVREDYLATKNKISVVEGFITLDKCVSDAEECAKAVRRTITFAERAFKKYLAGKGINSTEYLIQVSKAIESEKEAKKAAKAREKARAKELAYIDDHIHVSDEGAKLSFESLIYRNLNNGSHTGNYTACISSKNEVVCDEEKDYNGYSKRCNFTMIRRSFTLHLKKGYHIYVIGGLITFVRGEIKREGVACEWIVQGKAIADIHTVKGYLVRGEHIEAKSLKAAQRISKEHRNKRALEMMNARNKRIALDEKLAKHMFTFEESLASGNCRPGTQNFKNRYEVAVGHDATEISLADLRKYGRKFGLETYTERVINYVARHI